MSKRVSTVEVSFNPSLRHFQELENWLIEERKTSNQGFFCNWNAITSAFERKNLGIITADAKCIGFITWIVTSKYSANICLLEIHPQFRKQRYAEFLVTKFVEMIKTKSVIGLDLECEPETSIGFWKKLGFIDAPGNIQRWQTASKHVYKILKHSFEPSISLYSNEVIELWDEEPHMTTDKLPRWQSEPSFTKSGRLKTPIVHPCEKDWRIRWKKGDKILIDDKVKRLKPEIDFGPYMVITKRPTI